MTHKSGKIKTIFFIYWLLLLYVVSALIWWFIALSQQNKKMTNYEISILNTQEASYQKSYDKIMQSEKRKSAQYIGEGSIFLLLISVGAIFLFRAVNNQLKISEQQRNFMMAITHELKTPIAVSKLNLETLQKRKLETAQQEKLINNTLREADRMNALCNNLLLSYQMEASGYKITKDQINLSQLTEDCVNDFKIRFGERTFFSDIKNDIFINGDYFLLQIAINNLIDNANKYSNKDGIIKIIVDEKKHVEIIDEGLGVNDLDKNKVFQKFYRSGSEATQKSKGTGLGLYLVNRIISLHEGNIKIEDNLPMGAKFIINFNSTS
jgi:two-component system sensor histidine kinase CiaH